MVITAVTIRLIVSDIEVSPVIPKGSNRDKTSGVVNAAIAFAYDDIIYFFNILITTFANDMTVKAISRHAVASGTSFASLR